MKHLKRSISAGLFAAKRPLAATRALYEASLRANSTNFPQSLLPVQEAGNNRKRLQHIAALIKGNAGDLLLPITLRDLFDTVAGERFRWNVRHAHPLYTRKHVDEINAKDGVVIGGGGLFLRDTNPNPNSGWQWNCPVDQLAAINSPMAVFAVGYNRFRGQPDFDPVFAEHLTLLAEKATYIGLRNTGSIRAIKNYLPSRLHAKLRFQPCMTTLLSRLYPELARRERPNGERMQIAFNAAFDRPDLRYGSNEVAILERLCSALKQALGDGLLVVVSHCQDDVQILPFIRNAGIDFKHVNLLGMSPAKIIKFYSDVDLAIGMRGHSQMIPFGCGTPIVSLISHDKLQWFLDDIDRPHWGVEVSDSEIVDKLTGIVSDIKLRASEYRADVNAIQGNLWRISQQNVVDAVSSFSTT